MRELTADWRYDAEADAGCRPGATAMLHTAAACGEALDALQSAVDKVHGLGRRGRGRT